MYSFSSLMTAENWIIRNAHGEVSVKVHGLMMTVDPEIYSWADIAGTSIAPPEIEPFHSERYRMPAAGPFEPYIPTAQINPELTTWDFWKTVKAGFANRD